jgi:hypothetical protein
VLSAGGLPIGSAPPGREALQRTFAFVTLDPGIHGKGASFKEDARMHDFSNGRRVGRVVGLWRYPVKSMAGEALAAADVTWHGFAGDRRWAFVRDGVVQSGFPWLTLRERSDLRGYLPSFTNTERPDQSPTVVRTPTGTVFDVADPALAAELWPDGARVIRQDRGIFDTFPLSLISTRTIAGLGAIVGAPLEVARFRPNILVEPSDDAPFPEDRWVGSVLHIGGARARIDKRDGRCVVITIDPVTTQRNPEILRAVARERQGCLGVYGTTVEPGRIALDDPVFIE